jgi:hypothetical protein
MQKPDDMREDPPSFFLKNVEVSVQKCFFCLVLWSDRYWGAGRGPFQHSTAWYLKESLGLCDFGSIDKSQRPQKSSACYQFLHSTLHKTAWNSLVYICQVGEVPVQVGSHKGVSPNAYQVGSGEGGLPEVMSPRCSLTLEEPLSIGTST